MYERLTSFKHMEVQLECTEHISAFRINKNLTW